MLVCIDIGSPTIENLRIVSECLVQLDMDFLRRARGRVPSLYASGVRYRREGTPSAGPRAERFQMIPEVLRTRSGDCEDLSAWRVAELRLSGVRAIPWIIRTGARLYHVQVKYPDGRIEDPSKRLGMRGPG